MRQTILDTFDRERVRTGLTAGIATVGRPTGVGGKKMSPRRAKMTSKEVDHIKTRAGIKAGGPGSGRHPLGTYDQRVKKARKIIEQEKSSNKSKTHHFHNYQDKTKNGVSIKVGWEHKFIQWEPIEKVSKKAHKQLSQLADKVKNIPGTFGMPDNTRYIFNK